MHEMFVTVEYEILNNVTVYNCFVLSQESDEVRLSDIAILNAIKKPNSNQNNRKLFSSAIFISGISNIFTILYVFFAYASILIFILINGKLLK